MRNLTRKFDWHYMGQIYSGDFEKFCGLFRIYELYNLRLDFGPIAGSFLAWLVGGGPPSCTRLNLVYDCSIVSLLLIEKPSSLFSLFPLPKQIAVYSKTWFGFGRRSWTLPGKFHPCKIA